MAITDALFNPTRRVEQQVGGQPEPVSRHRTKEDAVSYGRWLAQLEQTEHIIHNPDGTINARNSYGPDPYPPRG